MLKTYLPPIIAVAGLLFAVSTVIKASQPVIAAPPVAEPSTSPFKTFVAGTGLVESSTENIAVAPVVPGVVTELFVKVGDEVTAGTPLFKLDDRNLQADLKVRQAALDAALATLEKLRKSPRPEDVPPAEAQVREADASLADMRNQLEMMQSVTDKRAISEEELTKRLFAVRSAEARFAHAKAQLTLLKAGTWAPDIAVAEAQVEQARAQVTSAETEIDRLVTRAPVDGTVLQVKVRLGEYAPTGVLQQPLILLGNTKQLHVRVDVDENDAWRMKEGASAEAYIRGNRDIHTGLEFVRFEPYVIPKRSLTGDSTERVDTRVLQVIYQFKNHELPVYVGQQMDVFIDAPDATPTTAETPAKDAA
jgi:HlyD family secretion protein